MPVVAVERTSEDANAVTEQQSAITQSEQEAKAFIYLKESSNRTWAVNKSSGACGIGQSLPCSKLSNVCPNWETDYACSDGFFTQYMIKRYGSWANAKAFWERKGWW